MLSRQRLAGVKMQRIGLALPSDLRNVRRMKTAALREAEEMVRQQFCSRKELFEWAKITVQEMFPNLKLHFKFFLRRNYENAFKSKKMNGGFRRCVGNAMLPRLVDVNLNAILSQISPKPPGEDIELVTHDGISENRGVIYIPNTAKRDFFFLCHIDVADIRGVGVSTDKRHLFTGEWNNKFARRLSKYPWMKSLLIVPILEVDDILGAMVVSSRGDFVSASVDLPWLRELSDQMGAVLFDIRWNRKEGLA